jgi:hypothetical protein
MVSLFATIGDVLKPKGFAGIFGAAPSVAFATLGLSVLTQSKALAAIESRSMIVGAIAFLIYANACLFLMGKQHWKAAPATLMMLPVWGLVAFALWSWFLR